MGHVVISAGHGPGSPTSESGAVSGSLVERDLIMAVVPRIRDRLGVRGHSVAVIESGPYRDRQEDWRVGTADCYLSMHFNAGGPAEYRNYALVCHDEGRDGSGSLAHDILMKLLALPPVSRAIRGVWGTGEAEGTKVVPKGYLQTPHGRRKHDARAWGDRGRVCVKYVPEAVPAVLIEPAFIDSESMAGMFTDAGLVALGDAIADAVADWLELAEGRDGEG